MYPKLLPLLWLSWSTVTEAQGGCGFHLTSSGGYNGSIGEKTSGQARGASDVTAELFTWLGDAFADASGNGCWWTPPTYTLQCDANQAPDHGFQIGCDGTLSYSGQSTFYECPTGNGDEVNIYLRSVSAAACQQITIHADGCASAPGCSGGAGAGVGPGAGSGTSVATQPATSPSNPAGGGTSPPGTTTLATPTASSSSSGPPTPTPFTTGPGVSSSGMQTVTTSTSTSTSTLTTTYTPVRPSASSAACIAVPPAQIILTDKANPNTAYGANSGMEIQVSPNASSIFNFVFGDSDEGRACEMFFLLPAATSGGGGQSFNLTGTTGSVTFAAIDGWADATTTYNSMPRTDWPLGNVALTANGVAQSLGRFECPGSMARTGVLMTEAPMADTCFEAIQGGVSDGRGLYLNIC